MGGEAFKRRLVHGVPLTIMAQGKYKLLKDFIANVLKCKTCLIKVTFMRYYVFL